MTQDHLKYQERIADHPHFLEDLKTKSNDLATKIKELA